MRKTLEIDAHFAPAHQTLGWAYLNQGKHEQAIQEFRMGLWPTHGHEKRHDAHSLILNSLQGVFFDGVADQSGLGPARRKVQ